MIIPIGRYIPLVLSVLSIAAAAPSPTELVPRACSTARTTLLSKLMRRYPDQTLSDYFALLREGGPDSNTIKMAVTFGDIPERATGCKLQFDLPKIKVFDPLNPLTNGTGTQCDVWSVKSPPTASPWDFSFARKWTWNNPPEKDQFVSTVRFPFLTSTDTPSKTTLWRGTCDRALSFLFELSDWQQDSGFARLDNDSGELEMIYDC